MIEYILGWLTFFAAMTALGLMLIKGMQDAVERREQNEIYRLAQEMAENAHVTVDARIVIIDEMGGAAVGSQKS
ncbi:MAG: hypothetical protein IJC75_01555 [Oscillospiraceae bacterium]|nr:hypothetical protein [Oscillospiraceae bacterium]